MKNECQCGSINIIAELDYYRDFDKPYEECPNCNKVLNFNVFDEEDESKSIGKTIHAIECPFCCINIKLDIEGYYEIAYSTSARIADETEKECD